MAGIKIFSAAALLECVLRGQGTGFKRSGALRAQGVGGLRLFELKQPTKPFFMLAPWLLAETGGLFLFR